MRRLAAAALALLAGCGGPTREPPAPLAFEGLPVAGDLAFAQRSGFTDCWEDTTAMRCRRAGVMLLGFGPYNGAVDLDGSNGGGGFDQLILWNDWDQDSFLPVLAALKERGWKVCYTGQGNRGDQGIYRHEGVAARISIDLSYWGKRRLRIIPDTTGGGETGC
ncbi:MAG: hypothetical protein E6G94_15395 [Alphaproteobacteria bacterium]|nr:MAG: hypothetical protein E6G94_15395 [Alphaproteobacteria bacterium]